MKRDQTHQKAKVRSFKTHKGRKWGPEELIVSANDILNGSRISEVAKHMGITPQRLGQLLHEKLPRYAPGLYESLKDSISKGRPKKKNNGEDS